MFLNLPEHSRNSLPMAYLWAAYVIRNAHAPQHLIVQFPLALRFLKSDINRYKIPQVCIKPIPGLNEFLMTHPNISVINYPPFIN